MANLVERSGGVYIRLGGNTQEFAALVDTLPGGHTFGKEDSGSSQTVGLSFGPELLLILYRQKRQQCFILSTCSTWPPTFHRWSTFVGFWVSFHFRRSPGRRHSADVIC